MQERIISANEYAELLSQNPTDLVIRKKRYYFIHDNLYFRLDIFPSGCTYAILEVQTTSEQSYITMPKWIEVIRDVTDEKECYNLSLARSIRFHGKLVSLQ